ncbi:MAG: hypothetical protein ACR2P3_02255, partial [Geminicoccaceae bacterium]
MTDITVYSELKSGQPGEDASLRKRNELFPWHSPPTGANDAAGNGNAQPVSADETGAASASPPWLEGSVRRFTSKGGATPAGDRPAAHDDGPEDESVFLAQRREFTPRGDDDDADIASPFAESWETDSLESAAERATTELMSPPRRTDTEPDESAYVFAAKALAEEPEASYAALPPPRITLKAANPSLTRPRSVRTVPVQPASDVSEVPEPEERHQPFVDFEGDGPVRASPSSPDLVLSEEVASAPASDRAAPDAAFLDDDEPLPKLWSKQGFEPEVDAVPVKSILVTGLGAARPACSRGRLAIQAVLSHLAARAPAFGRRLGAFSRSTMASLGCIGVLQHRPKQINQIGLEKLMQNQGEHAAPEPFGGAGTAAIRIYAAHTWMGTKRAALFSSPIAKKGATATTRALAATIAVMRPLVASTARAFGSFLTVLGAAAARVLHACAL